MLKWNDLKKIVMIVIYWDKENKMNINFCENIFLMDFVVCMVF